MTVSQVISSQQLEMEFCSVSASWASLKEQKNQTKQCNVGLIVLLILSTMFSDTITKKKELGLVIEPEDQGGGAGSDLTHNLNS